MNLNDSDIAALSETLKQANDLIPKLRTALSEERDLRAISNDLVNKWESGTLIAKSTSKNLEAKDKDITELNICITDQQWELEDKKKLISELRGLLSLVSSSSLEGFTFLDVDNTENWWDARDRLLTKGKR